MTKHLVHAAILALSLLGGAFALAPGFAQAPPQPQGPGDQEDATYTPPLRGAPTKRVGGASRGATRLAMPLPTIELLAPADHAGETISATPTLCYFVSQRVAWPMQLTIRAPLQPTPILEVTIPSAPGAGIYALRLADYRARLEPGIEYTWSVSIVVDPKAWSHNVVASAVIMRTTQALDADRGAPIASPHRAALLARAGLWYDAVAAAFDSRRADGDRTLIRLMQQVGLTERARSDRAATGTSAQR